jgi:hypothetical protein
MKELFRDIAIIVVLGAVFSCYGEDRGTSFDNKIKHWRARESQIQNIDEIVVLEQFTNDEAWWLLTALIDSEPDINYEREAKGKDHWKTSDEFMADSYTGDCEDIAIYFYRRVRESGFFSDSDLGIRIVGDSKSAHAILVIYTADGVCYIDNGVLKVHKAVYNDVLVEFDLFTIW